MKNQYSYNPKPSDSKKKIILNPLNTDKDMKKRKIIDIIRSKRNYVMPENLRVIEKIYYSRNSIQSKVSLNGLPRERHQRQKRYVNLIRAY